MEKTRDFPLGLDGIGVKSSNAAGSRLPKAERAGFALTHGFAAAPPAQGEKQ
jgi:hypothetical protein